jgi:hypothetical protein
MENKSLQQQQLEFLEETVAFYNSKNRCVIKHSDGKETCQYYIEGLLGCAIGRHVTNKNLCNNWDYGFNGISISVEDEDVMKALPKKLALLGANFLREVQCLHDKADNWNDNGISEIGLIAVSVIKRLYDL